MSSEPVSGREAPLPDRVGVVLGYRTWHLVSDPEIPVEESLRASYAPPFTKQGRHPWRIDAPTEAHCYPSGGYGDPPSWNCRCGLYANILPQENVKRYNVNHVLVYGAVLAWGRVIFHAEKSFMRARKMLPIAFMELPNHSRYRMMSEGRGSGIKEKYILSMEKLRLVSDALAAPIFSDSQALQDYAEAEVERW